MCGHGPRELPLKKTVQRFFLRVAHHEAGVFNNYTPSRVFLDLQGGRALFVRGNGRKQVKHLLIVDFYITHSNGHCLVKSCCYFMIYLSDSSRYNSSVFIFSATPRHRECLPRASLPVAHDRAIVSLDHARHELLRASLVNFVLAIN